MKNTVKAKAIEILEKDGKVNLLFATGEHKVVNNRQSLNNQFKLADNMDEPVIDAVRC